MNLDTFFRKIRKNWYIFDKLGIIYKQKNIVNKMRTNK